MEWLWKFIQTRVHVDQSTATGDGIIERVSALIVLAVHFLDTSIAEYVSKFLMITVDDLFLVLESPH
jgi:hypothetical protein